MNELPDENKLPRKATTKHRGGADRWSQQFERFKDLTKSEDPASPTWEKSPISKIAHQHEYQKGLEGKLKKRRQEKVVNLFKKRILPLALASGVTWAIIQVVQNLAR